MRSLMAANVNMPESQTNRSFGGISVLYPGSMSQGAIKKAGAVALAALGAILIASPAALASTVTVTDGNTVRVAETGNEVNQITVSVDPGTDDYYSVRDTAATLTPSGTCVAVDGHYAVCPGTGIKTIIVQTGDRADAITLDAPHSRHDQRDSRWGLGKRLRQRRQYTRHGQRRIRQRRRARTGNRERRRRR